MRKIYDRKIKIYYFIAIINCLFLIIIFLSSEENNKLLYKNYAIDISSLNRNLSDVEISFINEKYNLILVDSYNENLSNKKQILIYNLLFSEGNDQLDEKAYAHSIKSPFDKKRIKNKYNNKFLMNIFSKEYENFLLNNLIEKTKDRNFTGILFKDVDFNLTDKIDYAPERYNKNSYNQRILELLNRVKTTLKIDNILVSGLFENISSLPAINFFKNLKFGGMTENFVYSIFKIFNTSNEKIYVKFLNLINDFSSSKLYLAYNKLKGIYSEKLSTEERMYSFISYLFIFKLNVYYLIEDNSLNTPFQYYPEMDVDIGNPVENFSDITFYYDKYIQIYKRKFEKGIIMVNPFPFSKIITFDKYYILLKFSDSIFSLENNNFPSKLEKIKTKQIIIPAYSGVILLEIEQQN